MIHEDWELAEFLDDERDDLDIFDYDWDEAQSEDWEWSETITKMDHVLRQRCHSGYQPPS